MRRSRLLLVVIVLIVAAVLFVNDLTRLPPGFNSDEIASINVAETVRTGKIATFYNVDNRGYEGLYPVLEAATTSLIGDGLLCYRLLSAGCGLIGVALAFALIRRLFGSFAGIAGALTLALSLWPVILARSAIREAVLLPLVFGLLLVIARAVHLRWTLEPHPPATVPYAWIGVLIVLCIYTHWTGLVTPLLAFAFLVYLVATRQPVSRRVISSAAFTILVAIILGLPYLIFTLRSLRSSGLYTFWMNRPESVGGFLGTSISTLVSLVFNGDPSPAHNIPGLGLIGPLGAVLLLVGIVTAARAWRSPA
ncbi:MAG TPA: glycosyltransferase family 39 protein, partial [Aggregatilineales bacterium]|nr:glycosyltransferase family 39 protein [Aggregatilineales bacterium]